MKPRQEENNTVGKMVPIDLFNVGRVARKVYFVKKTLSAKHNKVKDNKINSVRM